MVSERRRWFRSPRFWVVAATGLLAAGWLIRDLTGAPLRVEPGVPWRVEFGRGSGMLGLETVKVSSDGTAVLHRFARPVQRDDLVWETTTLALPPGAVAEVLGSVERNGLLALRKRYSAGIHDGTQWVFWFRQRDAERAVYFDNEFPRAIERFAADLDRVLAENGLETAVWQQVPDAEARRHERELWDSIKR